MKKILALIITLSIFINISACSKNPQEIVDQPNLTNENTIDKTLNAAVLLGGILEEGTSFYLVNKGLEMAKEEFGQRLDYKTIEMTSDDSKWLDLLEDYAKDPKLDIIILGLPKMQERLKGLAPLYPEKKFIVFDQSLDFKLDELENVYPIRFKENEGGFLAGALGGKLSETKIIGFLGQRENQISDDFLIGYIQGAIYVEKDIKVIISYMEDSLDISKAKEIALEQYNEYGVDVGFGLGDIGGLGQIEAASQAEKFAIGYDLDQALILGEPLANNIPTSIIKNLDLAILSIIRSHLDGDLANGSDDKLGIGQGVISLADNEYYKKLVPQEIIRQVEEIRLQILEGEIKVDTAFGKTTDEIQSIKDSVK